MSLTLTPAQVATLKTYITTDPDGLGFAAKISVGDVGGILTLLNTTTPSYSCIRDDAPVEDILNAWIGANYTPADAPTSGNAAQATAASNYCMAKQQNLIMLGITRNGGAGTFNATRANNVATLKDATTGLPSKTGFANQTGGWTAPTGGTITIPMTVCRLATFVEKLFAVANTTQVPQLYDGSSATGTAPTISGVGAPAMLAYKGPCQIEDVQAALK